jgi:hypothetical protein
LKQKPLKLYDELEYAVKIEDLAAQQAYSKYSVMDVKLRKVGEKEFKFTMSCENIPEDTQHLSLILVQMAKCNSTNEKFQLNYIGDCFYAIIEDICGLSKEFKIINIKDVFNLEHRKLSIHEKYYIRFTPNRACIRSALAAIELIRLNKLENYFEKFGYEVSYLKKNVQSYSSFVWENKSIASNKEQMLAIKNILNEKAYPYPYVVFGPPGKLRNIIFFLFKIFT